ncbi:MAG: hypothetical protein PVI52_00270 [Chromatiales bacterium]|jgi:hypothetical protein
MATDLTFKPMGSSVQTRKGLERVADVDPRLTRSHYFDSRLLTAEDLTRDQIYLDGRLREVGQTLGYGILHGLETRMDSLNGQISVSPGMAVTRAGRVLELERSLTIDLGERADIVELNQGRNRRFDRALYAVIIKYAEIGTDIAEVFPTDLGDQRSFQYDVISEGVQLALVRLRLPLSETDPLQLRASLMHRLYGDDDLGGFVPEDAVALGVLAISNDRAQWLDSELLRQPLRAHPGPGALQEDLYRRYQTLFADVMERRRDGSLSGDFAATDYFRLLPPAGSLPKESLSPVTGRQGFFPENFNVWIAPVRKSELELIRRESMVLPPIDLSLQEPLDIIVLTPLSNSDYGHYAKRLERPLDETLRRLPSLDLLRLRLHPRRPVHELDTDESTWQAIWDTVNEDDLIYIRRPMRAAETKVSGIVLARGIELPPAPISAPILSSELMFDTLRIPIISAESMRVALPTPADENLLQDEDSVFRNRINISYLRNFRIGETTDSTDAADAMAAEFGSDTMVLQQSLNIFLRVERDYDEQIWQTILSLARSEQLAEFLEQLISSQDEGIATGTAVAAMGGSFALDASLITAWSNAVPS